MIGAELCTGRTSAGAVVIDERLHVFGGWGDAGYVKTIERYDD